MNYSTDKLLGAMEEVVKILQAGYIMEVQHPYWVSKVVMVKK